MAFSVPSICALREEWLWILHRSGRNLADCFFPFHFLTETHPERSCRREAVERDENDYIFSSISLCAPNFTSYFYGATFSGTGGCNFPCGRIDKSWLII
jgi:hypothetical protein